MASPAVSGRSPPVQITGRAARTASMVSRSAAGRRAAGAITYRAGPTGPSGLPSASTGRSPTTSARCAWRSRKSWRAAGFQLSTRRVALRVSASSVSSAPEGSAAAKLSGQARTTVRMVSSLRTLFDASAARSSGAPDDLAALASKSVLKLDTIRTVVLAWPESFAAAEPSGALDTLLAETRSATRLVLSWNPAALQDFLERHAHRAEVVGDLPVDADGKPLGPVGPARYVIAPAARRPAALRETIDAVRAARPVIWTGGDLPDTAGDAIVCAALPTRAQLTALAKLGRPLLLLTPAQLPYARSIAALTPVPLADAADRAQVRVERLRARVAELIERGAVDTELALLTPLFERFDAAEVAAALLALQRTPGAAAAEPTAAPAPSWVKVFVGVGKKDGAAAKDLVGALIREAGIAREDLGRIEVRETFSLVDVASHAADQAIQR